MLPLLIALNLLLLFCCPWAQGLLSLNGGDLLVKIRKASFGANIAYAGDSGTLYSMNPKNGCSFNLSTVSHLRPNQRNWIALISSDATCSFVTKSLNAQYLGAKAVVIINKFPMQKLIEMKPQMFNETDHLNANHIFIPCIMVTHESGNLIHEYLTDNNISSVPATITPDISLPIMSPFLERIIYIFIPCIICLLVSSLLAIHFMNLNQFNRFVQYFDIDNLSRQCMTVQFPNGVLWKDCRTCVICLEEFSHGERVKILPCFHAYHVPCIDKWILSRHRACPICKKDILCEEESTPLLSGFRHSV